MCSKCFVGVLLRYARDLFWVIRLVWQVRSDAGDWQDEIRRQIGWFLHFGMWFLGSSGDSRFSGNLLRLL